MQFLKEHVTNDVDNYMPLIEIFLTDGTATSGVTNTQEILQAFRDRNAQTISLFALGFGNEVDFSFLTKLAIQVRPYIISNRQSL